MEYFLFMRRHLTININCYCCYDALLSGITIMSDARNLVRCIARIWRMYKKQESLFRSAMGIDMSARLRRICSNGYMMSLLFKKDVGNMYESVKSILEDGELASITRSADDIAPDFADQQRLLAQLASHQQVILEEYKALLPQLDQESEAARACAEHMDKLSFLENSLSKEVEGLSDSTIDNNYIHVA